MIFKKYLLLFIFLGVLALLFYSPGGALFKKASDFFQGKHIADDASLSEPEDAYPFSIGSSSFPISADSSLYSASSSAGMRPEAMESIGRMLSSVNSYRHGIPDEYKEIPISSFIAAENIWSFLPPSSGFFYMTASSSAEILSFYRRKLSSKWFLVIIDELKTGIKQMRFIERPENDSLQAGQKSDRGLNIIVRDNAPRRLPAELKLKQGVFVYITFNEPDYFTGNNNVQK